MTIPFGTALLFPGNNFFSSILHSLSKSFLRSLNPNCKNMGRYALISDEKKKKFQKKFLPAYLEWKERPDPDDAIVPFVDFNEGTYPIYTSYFLQVGLRISFDPLLVNFLHRTRLHLSQLAPNYVRIILSVAEMNRRLGTQLDFWDIMYCYSLSGAQGDPRLNLKAKPGLPSLWMVYGIPASKCIMITS